MYPNSPTPVLQIWVLSSLPKISPGVEHLIIDFAQPGAGWKRKISYLLPKLHPLTYNDQPVPSDGSTSYPDLHILHCHQLAHRPKPPRPSNNEAITQPVNNDATTIYILQETKPVPQVAILIQQPVGTRMGVSTEEFCPGDGYEKMSSRLSQDSAG
ncbi:hypothetical protein BDV95DRAFT_669649 [Massariosphaeria phaeospora]|uniref:Uncharacterized protein n=1 Tax=Massariosphaeria phaeospora TaxID=100035 RepID=A0A7C8IAL4_9PLEO|nr:hypothetical protein BDV95DRAFT_669649 [Massariosphaeria phaeospora]